MLDSIELYPILLEFSARSLCPLMLISSNHHHIVLNDILLWLKFDYFCSFKNIGKKLPDSFLSSKLCFRNYMCSVIKPNGIFRYRFYYLVNIPYNKSLQH